MESASIDDGRTVRASLASLKADGMDTAATLQHAASEEVNHLLADVQDLLSKVGHMADPEIAKLRARLEAGVASARKAMADGSAEVQRRAKLAINAGDGYVREQPWQAVGIAAALGIIVGFLVARR